jgi:hypothetical protein
MPLTTEKVAADLPNPAFRFSMRHGTHANYVESYKYVFPSLTEQEL